MSEREMAGFIGTGKMGGAMVRRARAGGFPLAIYDLSSAATDALARADAGVNVASAAGEVAERARIVCIVVENDEQAESVLLGADGVLQRAGADHVIVIHSTLSLSATRTLAGAAEARGVPLLDAGVSGRQGQFSAERGELCVMVGGPRAAYDRAVPLFETYAGLVLHLGPNGCGMRATLARNAICYASYVAMFEGLELASAAGIEREEMEQILDYTGLRSQAMTSFLDHRTGIDRFAAGSEAAELAAFNARIGRKDLIAVAQLAGELGIEVPAVEGGIEAMDELFGAPDAS